MTKQYTNAIYGQNQHPTTLSFAWESDIYGDDDIVKISIDTTQNTDILVVIGYSFSFFNCEVDRKIIGSMANLKKVYFQFPNAEIFKERFEAIRDDLTGVALVTKKDIGQFFLPNEL
jgi:hypothetical protein